jgi:hypothetical protein
MRVFRMKHPRCRIYMWKKLRVLNFLQIFVNAEAVDNCNFTTESILLNTSTPFLCIMSTL